jgi:hypothetical protein
MNIDQQIIDCLYNNIYLQEIRCNKFRTGIQANSVWNKYTEEKKILDTLIEKYKNFYKNKAQELKSKLFEIKENNIKSYFTYDSEFYTKKYDEQMSEITKYISEIDTQTLESIKKTKLNFISKDINDLFPSYIVIPTLLGFEY